MELTQLGTFGYGFNTISTDSLVYMCPVHSYTDLWFGGQCNEIAMSCDHIYCWAFSTLH